MIYFDNAATTMLYPECADIMRKYGVDEYFNPSSLYSYSAKIKKDIDKVREGLISALGAPSGEIVFTGSGTESDNLALFGAKKWKNAKVVVSEGEHNAVYNSAKALKEQGYEVEFVPINSDGSTNLEKLEDALNQNTALVSVMHVSNETGAINDLKKISKLIKEKSPKAVFHSDGVQAFHKLKVNLRNLGVDLYSISAHKIHGPKGMGALYVKKGIFLHQILFGGGQEKGMRASTENVASICAFGLANDINLENFEQNYSNKSKLMEYFITKLNKEVPSAQIISPKDGVPNILTVAFENIRGEVLLHILEKDDILIGIGSACSSRKESRFKKLFSLDSKHIDGLVRFSFSEFNNINEVDFTIEKIKDALENFSSYGRK